MTLAIRSELSATDVVRADLARRRGADWKGVVFQILLLFSLVFALTLMVALLVDVMRSGFSVLFERGGDFLTSNMSERARLAGVGQAIVGSLLVTLFVVVFAFPVGIGAAVYLEEYARDNRITRFFNVNIRNLAGVPSVVYGLLGLAVFVELLAPVTGGRSVVSGGLTLALLVMPIVVITTAEALRAVPRPLREGGYAIGATRWEVTRTLVLPYAAPGILTGTILAMSRAIGEAAPLVLVGAVTGFFAAGEGGLRETFQGAFTALPVVIYSWARDNKTDFRALTAAAIIVLLVVLIIVNSVAIYFRNRYEARR